MLGMTLLPFFMYDARKPSTEKMINGGRTNLKQKHIKLQKNVLPQSFHYAESFSIIGTKNFHDETASEDICTSLGFQPRNIGGNWSPEWSDQSHNIAREGTGLQISPTTFSSPAASHIANKVCHNVKSCCICLEYMFPHLLPGKLFRL